MLTIQSIFSGLLYSFGETVLSPVKDSPKVELIVVMVILPLILDAVYFWIIDNILKLNPSNAEQEIQNMYLQMQEEPDNQIQNEQKVEIPTIENYI